MMILMQFNSPVDLTGNMNMIEKLVLGGTGTGDLPILSRTCWPKHHQDTLFNLSLFSTIKWRRDTDVCS